jgi:hypothetical protein
VQQTGRRLFLLYSAAGVSFAIVADEWKYTVPRFDRALSQPSGRDDCLCGNMVIQSSLFQYLWSSLIFENNVLNKKFGILEEATL